MTMKNLLCSPWYFEVVDVICQIDLATSSRFGAESYRACVERARDMLHRIVREWSQNDVEWDEQPEYLQCVDALSFLTLAAQARPVNRMYLLSAVEILRRLRDERGTA